MDGKSDGLTPIKLPANLPLLRFFRALGFISH